VLESAIKFMAQISGAGFWSVYWVLAFYIHDCRLCANAPKNNNSNNASTSVAQNKLSAVALMSVQTNMSLVSLQKSAKKRTQSEGLLPNCSGPHNRTSDHKCAKYSPHCWVKDRPAISRQKVSACNTCDRHTVISQIRRRQPM